MKLHSLTAADSLVTGLKRNLRLKGCCLKTVVCLLELAKFFPAEWFAIRKLWLGGTTVLQSMVLVMLTYSWRMQTLPGSLVLSLSTESPERFMDHFRTRQAGNPGCWEQSRIWEFNFYFFWNMIIWRYLSHGKCCWVLDLSCLCCPLSTIQNDGIIWSQSIYVQFKDVFYRKKWEYIALSFINTLLLFFLGYTFLWEHSQFNVRGTRNESSVLTFQIHIYKGRS